MTELDTQDMSLYLVYDHVRSRGMKQLSQQLYKLGVSAGIDLTEVRCPFKLKELFEACKEESLLKMSRPQHQNSPPLKKPKGKYMFFDFKGKKFEESP